MRLPDPPADTPSLDALRASFLSLPADRQPQWGRMDAARMLAHCERFNALCLGDVRVGAGLRTVARLLGPWFLKRFLRGSARRAPRNLRTLEPIRVDQGPPIEEARARVVASIDALDGVDDGHRHPLYGPMRAVDVRNLARHHMAHHAHQFGLW